MLEFVAFISYLSIKREKMQRMGFLDAEDEIIWARPSWRYHSQFRVCLALNGLVYPKVYLRTRTVREKLVLARVTEFFSIPPQPPNKSP